MTAITKLLDRFIETDIDEEIVIMRFDNGEMLSLAGTSATIWRLIDGRRDRAGLLAALAEEFPGAQPAIPADVDTFVTELKEAGLLGET